MTVRVNKTCHLLNNGKQVFLKELAQRFGKVITEYKFHASRKWRLDIYLPDHMLGLEIDGGLFMRRGAHNTGKAIMRDIEKSNAALMQGIIIYRIPAQELNNPDDIIKHLNNIQEVVNAK